MEEEGSLRGKHQFGRAGAEGKAEEALLFLLCQKVTDREAGW
jgi:hypothetical protein